MCLVNKVEIYFAKIGFMDCICSNLNAPGSYTPCSYFFVGFSVGCPFLCMQEKGIAACGLLIKGKFIFSNRFCVLLMSNLSAPGSYFTVRCPFQFVKTF